MNNKGLLFALLIFALTYVPLLPILEDVETFMHPWRMEIAAGIAIPVAALIHFLVKRKNLVPFTYLEAYLIYSITAFIFWAYLTGIWAGSFSSVGHYVGVWSLYLIVYIYARSSLFSDKAVDTTFAVFAVMAVLITAPPLIEYFSGLISGTPASIVARYAKYGELLIALIPLLLVYFVKNSGNRSVISLIALVLIYTLLFSMARRASLALAVLELPLMLIIIAMIRSYRPFLKKTIAITSIIIIAVATIQILTLRTFDSIPIIERTQSKLTLNSDNVRHYLTMTTLEMISSHPLNGIGADNFGYEYQKYRPITVMAHPDDPRTNVAEDMIAQRSHNEFLQICAELGFPGLALLSLIVALILILILRRIRTGNIGSIYAVASFIGIIGFLLSSLVSSFSFRLIQNGIIFFIIAAIGARAENSKIFDKRKISIPMPAAAIISLLIATSIALMLFFTSRSIYATYISRNIKLDSNELIVEQLQKAIDIDPENADLPNMLAIHQLMAKDFKEAEQNFRKAIDHGRINSVTYSNLTTASYLSGDMSGAISATTEALDLYPTSIFMLCRRSALLNESGKIDAGNSDLKKAISLNEQQALVWYNLILHGATYATKFSFENNLVPLMDLEPRTGVYAIANERQIRFPEEAIKIPESKVSTN